MNTKLTLTIEKEGQQPDGHQIHQRPAVVRKRPGKYGTYGRGDPGERVQGLPTFHFQFQMCHEALIRDISADTGTLPGQDKKGNGQHTGYLIDESAHLKNGDESVGVARQYFGVAGKVENCQVGVNASMVNGTRATLVNARLYLPKCL